MTERAGIWQAAALFFLLSSVADAQTSSVKAAYMYCSWPNGQAAFKNEFDEAFRLLGWHVTKFENTQAQELSQRLAEFDVVVGGGVSNLDNAQDFAPWATQWREFLQRGGIVIATDASYGAINQRWIGGIDPALATSSAVCSAHSKPSPETQAVTFASDDPLLQLPNDLFAGLRQKQCWAHLEAVGEGWMIAAQCYDGKPLFIYRPYGRGLVVVTSYFRFEGRTSRLAAQLLQNVLVYARLRQQGVALRRCTLPSLGVLGDNEIRLCLANISAEGLGLRAQALARRGEAIVARAEQAVTIPAGEEREIVLRLRLPERETYDCAFFLEREAEPLLQWTRTLRVPKLLSARLHWRHIYQHRPLATVYLELAPELQGRLRQLRLRLQPQGPQAGRPISLQPNSLSLKTEILLAGLAPGKYDLVVTLQERTQKIAEARAGFMLHPRPRIYFDERNVCFVDAQPFFPLGMYHVAWQATKEQMLQCVEDLAAAGFNCVHTSCTNLDNFQEVLDRAQALGLRVIAEGIGPGSPGLQRFRHHPAILAWNSGDEPDCHDVPPERVAEVIDAIRDTDPSHPLYTTVANPDVLIQYARYVDVFSNDPYPIARGNKDASAVAKQTALAREAVGGGKPLWIVPQCFGYRQGPWDVPTPEQLRSMTYQALIEGATGLIFYTYDDGGFSVREHPALWAMLQQLTREIKALSPLLLGPAHQARRFQAGPNNCIRACVINDKGRLYLLAAHTNDKDLGAQELAPPGCPKEGRAYELFEEREVIIANGRLRDAFGPYAVHVYKLTP